MNATNGSGGILTLVECPNNDDYRCANYRRTRTFQWFDGETGTNNYCPWCGSELVVL